MPLTAILPIGACMAQNHFAPDPKLPWAVSMCETALREGDILGYPEPINSGITRVASRYEYAVALHAAVTRRVHRLEAFAKKPSNDLERASLLRSAALFALYRRADGEFRIELLDLGVRGDYGLQRIDASRGRSRTQVNPVICRSATCP